MRISEQKFTENVFFGGFRKLKREGFEHRLSKSRKRWRPLRNRDLISWKKLCQRVWKMQKSSRRMDRKITCQLLLYLSIPTPWVRQFTKTHGFRHFLERRSSWPSLSLIYTLKKMQTNWISLEAASQVSCPLHLTLNLSPKETKVL